MTDDTQFHLILHRGLHGGRSDAFENYLVVGSFSPGREYPKIPAFAPFFAHSACYYLADGIPAHAVVAQTCAVRSPRMDIRA